MARCFSAVAELLVVAEKRIAVGYTSITMLVKCKKKRMKEFEL